MTSASSLMSLFFEKMQEEGFEAAVGGIATLLVALSPGIVAYPPAFDIRTVVILVSNHGRTSPCSWKAWGGRGSAVFQPPSGNKPFKNCSQEFIAMGAHRARYDRVRDGVDLVVYRGL